MRHTIKNVPTIFLFLVVWSICMTACATTIPFKIVDYNAVYNLHMNGTYTVTVHEVVMPTNAVGVQNDGQTHITFDADMETVTVTSAYTLTPSGRKIFVGPGQVSTEAQSISQSAPEFSEAKVTTIVFPHVSVGDDLVSNWRVTCLKPYFPYSVSITHTVPYFLQALRERVVVHAPADMHLFWEGSGGYRIREHSNTVRRTIVAKLSQTDPSAIRQNGLSFYQMSPTFIVTTFPNWQAIGKAYWGYAKQSEVATSKVEALARKLAAGQSGIGAIRAIYDWTITHIRWVGIETGLSGYRPQTPSLTLKDRYGDCKAAAALFTALLHSIGIVAQPVLLGAGNSFRLHKRANLQQLNHVIVYVPKYRLFVDPTSSMPFGSLPISDSNHDVIVASARPKILRTPSGGGDAGSNVSGVERLVMTKSGKIVGTEVLEMNGFSREVWRHMLKNVPVYEYGEMLSNMAGRAGSYNVSGVRIQGMNPTRNVLEMRMVWQTMPSSTTQFRIKYGLSLLGIQELYERIRWADPKYPILAPYGNVKWTITMRIPHGYKSAAQPWHRRFRDAAGEVYGKVSIRNKKSIRVITELCLSHMVFPSTLYKPLIKLLGIARSVYLSRCRDIIVEKAPG